MNATSTYQDAETRRAKTGEALTLGALKAAASIDVARRTSPRFSSMWKAIELTSGKCASCDNEEFVRDASPAWRQDHANRMAQDAMTQARDAGLSKDKVASAGEEAYVRHHGQGWASGHGAVPLALSQTDERVSMERRRQGGLLPGAVDGRAVERLLMKKAKKQAKKSKKAAKSKPLEMSNPDRRSRILNAAADAIARLG